MNATRAALRLAPSILVLALIGTRGLQTAPAAPVKDPSQLEAVSTEQAADLVRQSVDLVKQKKPLRLEVKELSADVATILAGSQAELHLPNLMPLTPEVAAALAPFPGTLSVGVRELSDEAAAALAKRAGITRLDALSSLDVREAGQGDVLEPGTCVLAPGDAHLALEFSSGAYRTKLLKTPPIHHCRPAVDVLFRSAAEAGGDQVVAALLTGMGSDGAIGMGAIRAAGGATIAEHESTCVVYGMPRAAIEAGAAERVLPLPAIADAIIDAVSHRARRS
jgi:hypothetical protein